MWRRLLFMMVTSALLVGSLPGESSAQMACGKRADFLAQFAKLYDELPSAIGITDQGALLDLLVSASGTWTMMLTVPGGLTCIVATGQQWETLPAVAEEPGA